jgi:hypothetical protein
MWLQLGKAREWVSSLPKWEPAGGERAKDQVVLWAWLNTDYLSIIITLRRVVSVGLKSYVFWGNQVERGPLRVVIHIPWWTTHTISLRDFKDQFRASLIYTWGHSLCILLLVLLLETIAWVSVWLTSAVSTWFVCFVIDLSYCIITNCMNRSSPWKDNTVHRSQVYPYGV